MGLLCMLIPTPRLKNLLIDVIFSCYNITKKYNIVCVDLKRNSLIESKYKMK